MEWGEAINTDSQFGITTLYVAPDNWIWQFGPIGGGTKKEGVIDD